MPMTSNSQVRSVLESYLRDGYGWDDVHVPDQLYLNIGDSGKGWVGFDVYRGDSGPRRFLWQLRRDDDGNYIVDRQPLSEDHLMALRRTFPAHEAWLVEMLLMEQDRPDYMLSHMTEFQTLDRYVREVVFSLGLPAGIGFPDTEEERDQIRLRIVREANRVILNELLDIGEEIQQLRQRW